VSSRTYPSLDLERTLFESGARFVIGVDEVGRGALFGPVAVGVAVISTESIAPDAAPWPDKLADSKLISEKVREQIFEPVGEWVHGWGVGMASNQEIDDLGIIRCLALAAVRAVGQLPADVRTEVASALAESRVILDGSHDWLAGALGPVGVQVRTKADRDCVSVAAASVLAKVVRDRLVTQLAAEDPRLDAFGVAGNKGYSSAGHIAALRELGPTPLHRKSWLTKILAEDALF